MFSSLLTAFVLAQQAAAAPDAQLAALLEAVRAKHDVPAAAAWVSRRGEPVAVAAVGLRRSDGIERVTVDDRFHLASVTKSLNATLIATWSTRESSAGTRRSRSSSPIGPCTTPCGA
jgi:CubicO group peptidase (beta-lactamase class C family)